MMTRGDLTEIRPSTLDLDLDLKPTPSKELVKNATSVLATGPTQQSLANSQTKCKVELVSNCITQDGDKGDQ